MVLHVPGGLVPFPARDPIRIRHHGQMPDTAHRSSDSELVSTHRTTLHRKKERGSHERGLVNAILDEGLLCHAGFSAGGTTFVMPMAYARIEDTLYLHGAVGNRMLRHMAEGAEVCVTVTLLDGIVLARSAFHHSMNYRSVVLLGTTSRVEDDDEKRMASTALLEHMVPGRSADARPPSPEELRTVLMVRLPITEGSAKVRSGGPIDEPEDLGEQVWAGVIPMSTVACAAIADRDLPPDVEEPSYVRTYPARDAGADADADADADPGVAAPAGPGRGVVEPGG
jgi:nitroimidazol reductase NimA-like FMN-containing flavoprotein (pyridoxamine 5'-phosphate oxidase superfamily)